MTESTTRVASSAKQDEDYSELRDPSVGFWEKWNKHATKKKTKGIIRHASFCNRWAPRIFYFACFGGTGWIVGGSIPYYYGNSLLWMVGMEVFTIYVFIQVVTNYFMTKNTDSSYTPEMSEKHAVTNDIINTSPQQQESQTQPSTSETTNSSSDSSYRILVVTAVTGNNIERKSFSYWSWVPCAVCERLRPPRCHHCSVCKKCVLKRDHHCYFTRICIGVNNHKFYMYFLLWCVVLTWLGSTQLVPYLFGKVLVDHSYWNLLLPFNLYSAVTGSLPLIHLHLILVVWAVCFLTFISTGMFSNGLYVLLRGLTSFEHSHKIKVVDTRDYLGRLRSVFGKNWAVHCFIPGYFAERLESCLPDHWKPTEPLEDAVKWPWIKSS